ncbi:MAG: nitroreductase [Kangiellaceae bacterium]|nr:nitroreductase [Kangiellaceae bacterium]
MTHFDILLSRKSHNKLCEPAPSLEELNELFKVALRAPDHAQLKPWRYLVYQGRSLIELGEKFAAASLFKDSELSADKIEKISKKPQRAPVVVISIIKIKDHRKVPEIEQILSAGAGVQNLIMAAHFKGYGAIWRTGELAFNRVLMEQLGLAKNERISGFIYLGTEEGSKAKIRHPEISEFVHFV